MAVPALALTSDGDPSRRQAGCGCLHNAARAPLAGQVGEGETGSAIYRVGTVTAFNTVNGVAAGS